MHVSLEYLASGEKQLRPEPVLVQNSGRLDDDIQLAALDVFYDLRRSEFNEFVESMTCLNALEGEVLEKRRILGEVRKITRTS